MGGQGITSPPYSHIDNCNHKHSIPIASYDYGPIDRPTDRQTKQVACSHLKKIQRRHCIDLKMKVIRLDLDIICKG